MHTCAMHDGLVIEMSETLTLLAPSVAGDRLCGDMMEPKSILVLCLAHVYVHVYTLL
jgi:hypothetical protein